MPGGKMETGESIFEAVVREVNEETGLILNHPELYSVVTMTKPRAQSPIDEWMMFTFKTDQFSGNLVEKSPEGELEWIPISQLDQIPTAPSDRFIHQSVLKNDQLLYASFELDENEQLISYRLNNN